MEVTGLGCNDYRWWGGIFVDDQVGEFSVIYILRVIPNFEVDDILPIREARPNTRL